MQNIEPMTHEIVRSDTKALVLPGGTKKLVLLSANLHAAASQEKMTVELFDCFKMQHILGPADTSMLLITVIGPCDPKRFSMRWRRLTEVDPVVSAYMSRMEKADLATASTSKASHNPKFCSLLAVHEKEISLSQPAE
jgi:hypothetical protein